MSNVKRKMSVVMLPTEKAKCNPKTQVIWLNKNGQLLHTHSSLPIDLEPQHLYILSSEKISEGEWYINPSNEIKQSKFDFNPTTERKIIATTNSLATSEEIVMDAGYHAKMVGITKSNTGMKRLIFLPQPSPEFISKYVEEYNAGRQIKDVMVEYEIHHISYTTRSNIPNKDKCIAKVNPKDNTITISKMKDIYTREEVYQLVYSAYNVGIKQGITPSIISFEDWIEQNL